MAIASIASKHAGNFAMARVTRSKATEPAQFDVSSLDELGMDQLRARWRQCLGEAPPHLRAPELLRRELAWRLEAQIHGDMDLRLRQRLDRLARETVGGQRTRSSRPAPSPGTTLLRESDGVTHSVIVLKDGYLFEGENYRSLSQIARRITGVRWSGPRFFGLTGGKSK